MPDRTTSFLIYSHEHGAFWRHARRGYTGNLLDAGLYDAAEAERICEGAAWRWRRSMAKALPPEVMVPLPVRFATRGIDDLLAELRASIDAATRAAVAARIEDCVSTVVEPSACAWCDLPQRGHFQRYADMGWHKYQVPGSALIMARMVQRRTVRSLTAEV